MVLSASVPHVLLVDDSQLYRAVTSGVLRKNGFRVTCVNDGREAVAALQKRDYDVVLMDIEMPEMDGLAATVEIRQLETMVYVYTPIVAFASGAGRDRCFAVGMDAFAAKPLTAADLEMLVAIVAKVKLRLDTRTA